MLIRHMLQAQLASALLFIQDVTPMLPGLVVLSVACLTQEPEVRSTPGPTTFVSPSADSRWAVVSYWQKYVHEGLVNGLGGLSLPRKCG